MSSIDRLSGVETSVAIKAPVRVAAASSSAPTSGLSVVDGVQLAVGDRYLRWRDSDKTQHGIWVVGTGSHQRAEDFNGSRDVVKGTQVLVTDGDTYAGTSFQVTTESPVVGGEIAFSEVNPRTLERVIRPSQDGLEMALGSHEGSIENYHFGAMPPFTCIANTSENWDIPIKAGVSQMQNALEIERSFNTVAGFMAADIGERVPQVSVAGVILFRSPESGTIIQDGGEKWSLYGPALFRTRAAFLAFDTAIKAANGSTFVDDDVAGWAGHMVRFETGSTAISEALGWVPTDTIRLTHFGDNTNPGVTNMAPALIELRDWLAKTGLNMSTDTAAIAALADVSPVRIYGGGADDVYAIGKVNGESVNLKDLYRVTFVNFYFRALSTETWNTELFEGPALTMTEPFMRFEADAASERKGRDYRGQGLTFEGCWFDGDFVASCAYVRDYYRAQFIGCYFIGWKEGGNFGCITSKGSPDNFDEFMPRSGDSDDLMDNGDLTTWTASNVTLTPAQNDADEGSAAYLLTASATGVCSLTLGSQSLAGANEETRFAVIVAAGTADWVRLRLTGYDGDYDAYFDLTDGTVGAQTGVEDAGMEQLFEGFWQCWIDVTSASDITGSAVIQIVDGNSSNSADSGDTLYAYDPAIFESEAVQDWDPAQSKAGNALWENCVFAQRLSYATPGNEGGDGIGLGCYVSDAAIVNSKSYASDVCCDIDHAYQVQIDNCHFFNKRNNITLRLGKRAKRIQVSSLYNGKGRMVWKSFYHQLDQANFTGKTGIEFVASRANEQMIGGVLSNNRFNAQPLFLTEGSGSFAENNRMLSFGNMFKNGAIARGLGTRVTPQHGSKGFPSLRFTGKAGPDDAGFYRYAQDQAAWASGGDDVFVLGNTFAGFIGNFNVGHMAASGGGNVGRISYSGDDLLLTPTNAAGSALDFASQFGFDRSAGVWFSEPALRVPEFTVATLPNAATAGAGTIAAVSDATSPVKAMPLTGGGSAHTLVLSDGTQWVVG